VFRPFLLSAALVAFGVVLLLLCRCSTADECTIDSGRTAATFETRSLGWLRKQIFGCDGVRPSIDSAVRQSVPAGGNRGTAARRENQIVKRARFY
jgi:hypothetical protein